MPEDKASKRAAKILALRMRLIYVILRLFVWGSLFLGTRILRKCEHIPLTSIEKPAVIVSGPAKEKLH